MLWVVVDRRLRIVSFCVFYLNNTVACVFFPANDFNCLSEFDFVLIRSLFNDLMRKPRQWFYPCTIGREGKKASLSTFKFDIRPFVFKLDLRSHLHFRPVRFRDCVLHCWDAIAVTILTDWPVKSCKALKHIVCGISCYSRCFQKCIYIHF